MGSSIRVDSHPTFPMDIEITSRSIDSKEIDDRHNGIYGRRVDVTYDATFDGLDDDWDVIITSTPSNLDMAAYGSSKMTKRERKIKAILRHIEFYTDVPDAQCSHSIRSGIKNGPDMFARFEYWFPAERPSDTLTRHDAVQRVTDELEGFDETIKQAIQDAYQQVDKEATFARHVGDAHLLNKFCHIDAQKRAKEAFDYEARVDEIYEMIEKLDKDLREHYKEAFDNILENEIEYKLAGIDNWYNGEVPSQRTVQAVFDNPNYKPPIAPFSTGNALKGSSTTSYNHYGLESP